ncbi:CHAT domain-containing protein [Gloeopeniophorella convolvens]|nr:CHAT domain-containing protein [Gloeopeniophorella convolvens]
MARRTPEWQAGLAGEPDLVAILSQADDFRDAGQEAHLEAIIPCSRAVLAACAAQPGLRFEAQKLLASSLGLRWVVCRHTYDILEAMEHFRTAVEDECASPSARYDVACKWTYFARISRCACTALAYRLALALLQTALAAGPTVQMQHSLIGHWSVGSVRLPLDAASYHVGQGRIEEAVETLEQGRALLWAEMRGFRTSTEKLQRVDPALAARFVSATRALEALATSLSQHDGPKPGGRELSRHHDPDSSMPFEILREAALYGPLIIVNHCHFRCDIVIVFRDSPPVAIPIRGDPFRRAQDMATRLLDSRDHTPLNPSSLPTMEALMEHKIPEQSRVWWCPTSVFCSLPLHAMGPISPSDPRRYFSDVYVCSYTPTLAALIESRKNVAQVQESPSLLIIAQPDESLPGVQGEIKVVQALGKQTTTLMSEAATTEAILAGFANHRMVHFACHGTLHEGAPFEASFELHGGERLTLLDIAGARLPAAELAFLSACHTAELTDRHTPDEALHLAAAMQYCGFRSVVGTMWAMADADGRDLSRHFYKKLLADGGRVVSVGERAAEALRDAVQKLRRKRGMTLERWVNFVHYGA